MRILKAYLMVVALAAPISSASAQEEGTAEAMAPATISSNELARDQGWDGTWALLFDLNNIFTNSTTIDMAESLGVGIEYFVNPTTAARLVLNIGRDRNAVVVTKTTEETSGVDPVITYSGSTPGYTTQTSLYLHADLLMRLLQTAVAPYAGAGLFVGVSRRTTDYQDDYTTVDQVTTYDNAATSLNFGVRGILGAEWRIHPNFSLMGEYNLGVTVLSSTSIKTKTTTEVTAGGQRTVSQTTSESKTPEWFQVSTGLTHAGQLGLAVHFM